MRATCTLIRGTRIGYLPQESEPAGNESVMEMTVPHEAQTRHPE